MTKRSSSKLLVYYIAVLLGTGVVTAQVRLPKLVSDGMVLQRETELKIWGWSSPKERITINFLGKTYRATADAEGEWFVMIPSQKAGGPYEMTIKGANSITLHNVLVGDVWLCSGQSNMETPMKRVSWIYPDELTNANYPMIRQFYVPRRFDFQKPQTQLGGGQWVEANPESVKDFSAVAYFFAKEIYNKYEVPIGLINSALGGSAAESWVSEEAIKNFSKYTAELPKLRDSVSMKEEEASNGRTMREWTQQLKTADRGRIDKQHPWSGQHLDTSDWDEIQVPGFWSDSKLGRTAGVVWFRTTVNVPAVLAGKPARLILGRIVDADSAFVNGAYVGSIGYQYPPRRYDVPDGLLKQGTNSIAVRIVSNNGGGGFAVDKPYQLEIENTIIDLKGTWKYKLGAPIAPPRTSSQVKYRPVGLYNGMIAPLTHYAIKGVIWYQGETNADRSADYADLMKALIGGWRKQWQRNVPFVYVQLPNYGVPAYLPHGGDWAELREAQLSLLSTPGTAMAVTIDVGEWNDIHPLRKKEVGERVALAARHVAYGEKNLVYSGPIFKAMHVEGSKIVLTFEHTGSGLTAKGETLNQFAIAGADKKFVWAQATIAGDKVIVWSDEVKEPTAVRYAWADNPEGANLYNKEGLPASPFRTDR